MSLSKLVSKIKSFFGFKEKNNRQNLLVPNAVNERNNKIRELRKQNSSDAQTKEKQTCPECHTVATLHKCNRCGKEACSFCLIYSPQDHKYYCEDCWSESESKQGV